MDILTTEGMEFIRLWLEYEAVSFNPRTFLAFEFRDIAHRFSPEVCEVAPELDMLYEAQSVKLCIKASANHPHWRDKAEGDWSYKHPPFEVIRATSCLDRIEISYRDGRKMIISVPWESFVIEGKPWLEERNMLQKAWIDRQGCLNVSVAESNREEVRHEAETTGYPAFSTAYYTQMREVIHDYSDFDFTRVPLLETEEHFTEYDRAFVEKYGKDEEKLHEMAGFYNFVSRIMGHGYYDDEHKRK